MPINMSISISMRVDLKLMLMLQYRNLQFILNQNMQLFLVTTMKAIMGLKPP